ncbi:MAG: hypothetical protein H6759_02550 [Candidatus Nomurabacteria bacterium]|nr:MAG: hypothetical protein H6759_02550 [Candidatus Nomurabacteria bacterium]
MDRIEWQARFNLLPQSVSGYLLSTTAEELEDSVREDLGYDYDAWSRIIDVIWELFLTHLDKDNFVQKLIPLLNGRDINEVLKKNTIKDRFTCI